MVFSNLLFKSDILYTITKIIKINIKIINFISKDNTNFFKNTILFPKKSKVLIWGIVINFIIIFIIFSIFILIYNYDIIFEIFGVSHKLDKDAAEIDQADKRSWSEKNFWWLYIIYASIIIILFIIIAVNSYYSIKDKVLTS